MVVFWCVLQALLWIVPIILSCRKWQRGSGEVFACRLPQVNHEDAGGASELLAHGDQVELFESAWPASPRSVRDPTGGDLERQRRLLQRVFTRSGELPQEPLSPRGSRAAERVAA